MRQHQDDLEDRSRGKKSDGKLWRSSRGQALPVREQQQERETGRGEGAQTRGLIDLNGTVSSSVILHFQRVSVRLFSTCQG